MEDYEYLVAKASAKQKLENIRDDMAYINDHNITRINSTSELCSEVEHIRTHGVPKPKTKTKRKYPKGDILRMMQDYPN